MPVPLVGAAVAVATRLAAKKLAQKRVKQGLKKAAARRTAKIASNSVKPVKAGAANAAKFNQGSMMRTTDAATGAAARKGAARLGVTGKKGVQPPVKIRTQQNLSSKKVKDGVKELKADAIRRSGQWSTHPGAASYKSSQRLQKGKWSSERQIAKYQKQEVKQDIKANARGLKAANKPKPKKKSK